MALLTQTERLTNNFDLRILVITIVTLPLFSKNTKQTIFLNICSGISSYNRESSFTNTFNYEDNYQGTKYFSLGLDYNVFNSKNTEVGTGLYVNSTDFGYTSNNSWQNRSYDYTDRLFFFSIPLRLKYHFFEYLYLEGNFSAIYTTFKDYNFGAGIGAGIGFEYIFDNGLLFSIDGRKKWNYLSSNSNRLISLDLIKCSTIGIGVGYRF